MAAPAAERRNNREAIASVSMARVLETPMAEPDGPAEPAIAGPVPGEAAGPGVGERPVPPIAGPVPSEASTEVPERPPGGLEGGGPSMPRHPRRWPVRLLRACLVLLLIPATVLASAEVLTPPVAGAPALVASIDAAHHARPVEAAPSWRVSQAIVAAEDGGFYSNWGVDVPGLARALWGWFVGVDEGGSTITEQLAKVIYTGGRTGILDRAAQVALALKLDGHYTKTAILSMYLSAIYFGNGYYGVLAASQGYFGLSPDRLSWGQASLLAGLPQAPTLLDPLHNLGAARARQSYVLDRLVATGVLTRAQANAAASSPLDLR